MTTLVDDVRHATRALRRSPGYTALCVLALALGVGANGAIFGLVESVMLRPLPYPDADRLVLPHMTVTGGGDSLGAPPRMPWSHPKLEVFAKDQRVFAGVAGFGSDSMNLTGGSQPERVQVELVSPGYFDVLGVRPQRGRAFVAADGRAGAPLVAMIADELWQRRFGADPAVLGRVVHLDKAPVTVVGVAPRGFGGLTGDAELWVTVNAVNALWYPEALGEVHNHWLEAVARLRPGVGAEQLPAEMERVGRVVAAAYPVPAEIDDGSVWSAAAVSLAEARRDPFVRRALLVLLAAVGAVLLIACANLASLALVRAARRRRAVAIRRAIGASTGNLVRLALVEHLLVALLGGAAGLFVAAWLVRAFAALRPEALGTWGIGSTELLDLTSARLDGPVVVFCALATVVSAVFLGLAPALLVARRPPGSELRSSGGAVAGTGGAGSWGGGWPLLVAGQVTLAVVTLVGAGLLLRSLWGLQHVELGFAPQRVLTFSVAPASGEYGEGKATAFHAALLESLRTIPGVERVALGDCVPACGEAGCNSANLTSLDGQAVPQALRPSVGWHKVSDDYFATLGIPFLAGRPFDGGDREGAGRVVILNETAARRLFPGRSAVGHRLQLSTLGLRGDVHAEVVGVVRDVRYRRLEEAAAPEAFLPDAQVTLGRTTVFLRSRGNPLAVVAAARSAVARVNPELPIYSVRTLEEQLGFALSRSRFGSLLLTGFALVALVLAALGVYGVLAQAVVGRRREIGVRMALGAAGGQVERLVLRQGMKVALAGLLAGAALSMGVAGALRGLLYEIPARDPWTLAAVSALLIFVAALACWGPARRAARVDPMTVLRQD
jgi:predicted permease